MSSGHGRRSGGSFANVQRDDLVLANQLKPGSRKHHTDRAAATRNLHVVGDLVSVAAGRDDVERR